MNFGKINKFVLFGGGPLICFFSSLLKEKNLKCITIVSSRHAREKIKQNKTLETLLSKTSFFNKLNKLDLKKINEIVGPTENTLFISFNSPWIFSKDLIKNVFANKLINSHSTRLPYDKGGGGFSWRILNYDRFGTCLLHTINDNKIDAGDILMYEEFLFPHSLKKPIDFEKYQNEREKLFLKKFLDKVIYKKKFQIINQPSYLSTYKPRLSTTENGWIDWNVDIIELYAFICAFDDPYVGSSTYLNNKLVRIKSVNFSKSEKEFHPYEYGLVFRRSEKWIVVACKAGCLIVEEVLDIKGNNIINKVKTGDRFITPYKKLDEAKKRVFYTPQGKK